MQIFKGNTVVAEYKVSDVDSVKFIEKTTAEVEINGIIWATRNVDAPGTFATTPESAGMFYQWNRKVGWSSTDPMVNTNGGTTWDDSTPSGTEWEAANDPCPAGWRVPSLEEIKSLLNTTYVSNKWTTYLVVNGRMFTDKTTGASLFLPAAGYRSNGGGTLYGTGTFGLYLSSTQSGSLNAYHLDFRSDYAGWLSSSRSFGFSVRCVKE
jgi:uncharacterized protein (TIGR02145 family)